MFNRLTSFLRNGHSWPHKREEKVEIFTTNIVSVCILLVNFIVTISYFIIYSNVSFKDAFSKLPVIFQKLYVALFVFPLFISPFFSISKFTYSNTILIILGILIAVTGLVIIFLSFLKIGAVPSIKNDDQLSTTGTYKIVRHPIYFGTILTQLGLILLNQALVPLFYFPLSIILYYIMATIEENDLIQIFGQQYIDFRSKTKGKIIPYLL